MDGERGSVGDLKSRLPVAAELNSAAAKPFFGKELPVFPLANHFQFSRRSKQNKAVSQGATCAGRWTDIHLGLPEPFEHQVLQAWKPFHFGYGGHWP